MSVRRRIYMDNAATSWPKRTEVLDAVQDFLRTCGATAGRGAYESSMVAERHVANARAQVSRVIGSSRPDSVAFCSSGTHSLNVALWGFLNANDHVVATTIEHNSVLRPLEHIKQRLGIEIDYVPCQTDGSVDIEQAASLIRDDTKLIVLSHASNVTGAVQPLSKWSRLAKKSRSELLIDASQSLGYIPINVEQDSIGMLAAAAHKGLGAISGTGILYVAPHLQSAMKPLMTGGTGRMSDSLDYEKNWPHSVEVGNANMAGIVSMAAAAEHLLAGGAMECWVDPYRRLVEGLMKIPVVKVYGSPASYETQVPVLSCTVEGWDVHDLATVLDTEFGIEARTGWHCAALIHGDIGSGRTNGTLRFSVGHETTQADVDQVLEAMRTILAV